MSNKAINFKHKNSTKNIQNLLDMFNYKLKTEYHNNHSKLLINCDISHVFNASWLEISKWSKKGSRKFCPICRKTFKLNSIDLYKWWYGDNDGIEKYNISKQNKKNANSLENYIRKYGKKIGTERYNSWKTYGISLDNYIFKHGIELGIKKWNNYLEMHSNKRSLENYITRLGIVNGEKEFYSHLERNRKSKTIIGFIEKYGEELGKKKYKEWINKCSSWGRNGSKISIRHIMPPLLKIGLNLSDIYIGISGSKELSLLAKNGKIYWYDCAIPTKKLIIEFNSNAWHPDKNRLGNSFNNWKPPKGNISSIEKYDYDQLKIKSAIDAGYKVLIIWQEDGIDHNHILISNFINQ